MCTGMPGEATPNAQQARGPGCQDRRSRMLGPPGELQGAGEEGTRSVAAASDPGSALPAAEGGSGSRARRAQRPALLDRHLQSGDRSVLRKHPRSLRKQSAPRSQDSAKEAKSQLGPGGSERGHQAPWVSVRVERPLRAGPHSASASGRRVSSALAQGESACASCPGEASLEAHRPSGSLKDS